ncbi:MAG: hypothetical protein ACTS2F_27690 [Thainema sp.]
MAVRIQQKDLPLLAWLALGTALLLLLIMSQRRKPVAIAESGIAATPVIEVPKPSPTPTEPEQEEPTVDPDDSSTWKTCIVPPPCAVLPPDPKAINPDPLAPNEKATPWYEQDATPCFGKSPSCG